MAYSLIESGILPVAGGWADQSASFVAAVGVINAERAGEIERQKEERSRRIEGKP